MAKNKRRSKKKSSKKDVEKDVIKTDEKDVEKQIPDEELPFVSVCTPTFNRRPFIKYALKCFEHQDYPKDKLEWVIIDDGTDKIEDLVKDIPRVKYYKYDEKMILGRKRNIMHEKCSGDIIVYMDDDDYYPPTRVRHAVNKLMNNEEALCAGSSILHVWYTDLNKIIRFGPYGPKHATAGTFAFKRKLLEISKYDESRCFAEEKSFLKNYTIPFVQLDSKKTILVFAHEQNTVDKKKIVHDNNKHMNYTDLKVTDFIEDPDFIEFYTNPDKQKILENYEEGDRSNKKGLVKQIKHTEIKRLVFKIKQSNGSYKHMRIEEIIKSLSETQISRNSLLCENKKLKSDIAKIENENKKLRQILLDKIQNT